MRWKSQTHAVSAAPIDRINWPQAARPPKQTNVARNVIHQQTSVAMTSFGSAGVSLVNPKPLVLLPCRRLRRECRDRLEPCSAMSRSVVSFQRFFGIPLPSHLFAITNTQSKIHTIEWNRSFGIVELASSTKTSIQLSSIRIAFYRKITFLRHSEDE